MGPRYIALSILTESWSLRLTSATDPERQLSSLAALLHRDVESFTTDPVVEVRGVRSVSELSIRPSIFENTIYSLSVKPVDGNRIERVGHPLLRDIENSLEEDDGVWRGTIRTGNDIGWFPLEIDVRADAGATIRTDRVAWQVWPLKLDYATDLKALVHKVEAQYPLWIFKFASQTEHSAGRSNAPRDQFLLHWMAQFRSIWRELERGMRVIVMNPHVVLQSSPSRSRADSLRGRLSRRLEEEASQAVVYNPERKLRCVEWRSSADTPENRFIRYALNQCIASLSMFRDAVDFPGLSPSFRRALDTWIRTVSAFRSDPLFRGVGDFTGLSRESLVLQNRIGYATVYRSWLKLRHNLQFFSQASSARMSMRSISELYEIWCFIAIKEILEAMGFEPIDRIAPLWRKQGVERQIENGAGASFWFSGDNGLSLSLSHEPSYGPSPSSTFHCPTVPQRPDIVLEARWPAGNASPERRLLWVFDAKYRLAQDGQGDARDYLSDSIEENPYRVPPDAIDQMHRYRDSILLRSERGNSRPVVSAIALYPGVFDQSLPAATNPYLSGIESVGVGAFPLLPGDKGSQWLRSHLEQALCRSDNSRILRRRSVRIPVSGLEYPEEDVLIVFLGRDRLPAYLKRFKDGYATVYHIYERGGPSAVRLGNVRFLAFIDVPIDADSCRMIRGAYPIESEESAIRSDLDAETTGSTRMPRDAGARCLLFKLGKYLQLPKPIPVPRDSGHWFRYASINRLFSAPTFNDLWSSPEDNS